MKFTTTIHQQGNNTGVRVPDEIVEALGAGRKPKVVVRLNGHTYRSSIASMGGQFLISLSAANRAAAGVQGGDAVEVEIEIDDAPRAVELPPDLTAALAAHPAAQARFAVLSYSNQLRHALLVSDAKTPETQQKRIDKVLSTLAER